jgi:hypothetical protein
LADSRHKLSILYKHGQLMHNELRYQAKTHAIADTPRKENNKILASSPPIFFLKKKKTCFIGK